MISAKIGIQINRPVKPEKAPSNELLDYPKSTYSLTYDFKVGEQRKSSLDFVTTPDVQMVISKANFNAGLHIGSIILMVFPEKKLIEYFSYFPIDMHPKKYWEKSYFEGVGLATLLEFQVLRDLNQKFPGYSIRHDNDVYEPRKIQLHKRGIRRIRKKIPLKKAIEMCRKQIQKNYFKNHPEKRQPPKSKGLFGKLRKVFSRRRKK